MVYKKGQMSKICKNRVLVEKIEIGMNCNFLKNFEAPESVKKSFTFEA
jgi:hypothetical protein